MCIDENVLRYDSVGKIMKKYFDAHYINPNFPTSNDSHMFLEKSETRLTANNKAIPRIDPVQPEILGKLKWIQQYWQILLNQENKRVLILALLIVLIIFFA